jgi:hypothetical protein
LKPIREGRGSSARIVWIEVLDVVTAAARQNNGNPEGASAALTRLILSAIRPH